MYVLLYNKLERKKKDYIRITLIFSFRQLSELKWKEQFEVEMVSKQKLCILNLVLQLSAMKLLLCHWPGKGFWPPGQSHQYHPWGKMKPTLASQPKLFWLCHCLLYHWTACHLDGRQVFTPRRKPGTSGVPWPGMNASAINRKTGKLCKKPSNRISAVFWLIVVLRVGYVILRHGCEMVFSLDSGKGT